MMDLLVPWPGTPVPEFEDQGAAVARIGAVDDTG